MRRLLGAVFSLLIASGLSFASDLKNENLLVGMPEGYKVAFSQNKNGLLVSEMIPRGQSLKNWKDMVTVQIHFSRRVPMKVLEKQYTQVKSPICKQQDGRLLRKGRENGYEFGLFLTSCTTTPASKSETVLTKAILGHDSTYFVIKSWRSKVGKSEIAKWSRYLSGVKVCDSRIEERECP